MNNKFFLALVGAFVLLTLTTSAAFASNIYEDKVVFGEDFTLASGQTINGNLIVFGGNVVIEKGATVTENVTVFGGNVRVAGEVKQDVVIFGGNADVQSTAVVSGKLVAAGGNISRQEGAVVKGGETQGLSSGNFPVVPLAPTTPRISSWPSYFDPYYLLVRNVGQAFGMAFALGIIALLISSLWSQPLEQVTQTITHSPAAAGGFGLLTLIVGVVLMIGTAVTICLSPITAVLAILYVLALIFGWIGLGSLIGVRLAHTFNWQRLTPAMAAGLGTVLFSLVSSLVSLVPCLGAMINIAFAAIGMGAVILTRFGTRLYPATSLSPLTSAPAPADSATPPAA